MEPKDGENATAPQSAQAETSQEKMSHVQASEPAQTDGKPVRTFRGRRVIDEDEMAQRDCPLPREDEWEMEWRRWEAEQRPK